MGGGCRLILAPADSPARPSETYLTIERLELAPRRNLAAASRETDCLISEGDPENAAKGMPIAVGDISDDHTSIEVNALEHKDDPDATCMAARVAEAEPLKEKSNKRCCCPRVEPSDTVTACCPRLGRYCCVLCMVRGRAILMQGPDWLVTWFCLWPTVLIPTGAFLTFAVPWMANKSVVLAFVSSAVIFWFWFTLFAASCTNPGILMKYNEPNPDSPNTAKDRRGALRKCNKCKLYQPPNTSHCGECGVCVYGYDHHCGFMGQCVGGLNLWAFQCFLGGICVVVVFMMVAMMVSTSM